MKLIKYMLSVLSIAFFVCNGYAQTPRTTELQITFVPSMSPAGTEGTLMALVYVLEDKH